MSFFSGLELVKHDVERGIVEHKVDFVLVELADHGEGHVVVRVDEHQVLDEQDVHDVGSVAVEYWDAGITLKINVCLITCFLGNGTDFSMDIFFFYLS